MKVGGGAGAAVVGCGGAGGAVAEAVDAVEERCGLAQPDGDVVHLDVEHLGYVADGRGVEHRRSQRVDHRASELLRLLLVEAEVALGGGAPPFPHGGDDCADGAHAVHLRGLHLLLDLDRRHEAAPREQLRRKPIFRRLKHARLVGRGLLQRDARGAVVNVALRVVMLRVRLEHVREKVAVLSRLHHVEDRRLPHVAPLQCLHDRARGGPPPPHREPRARALVHGPARVPRDGRRAQRRVLGPEAVVPLARRQRGDGAELHLRRLDLERGHLPPHHLQRHVEREELLLARLDAVYGAREREVAHRLDEPLVRRPPARLLVGLAHRRDDRLLLVVKRLLVRARRLHPPRRHAALGAAAPADGRDAPAQYRPAARAGDRTRPRSRHRRHRAKLAAALPQ
mmetsp:Transcript_64952/g.178157  ORF Transcript_64952/g.178157 Transcript_64952/m.178157 type:complete len:397 (-) Transcript_64952:78-1268(-)